MRDLDNVLLSMRGDRADDAISGWGHIVGWRDLGGSVKQAVYAAERRALEILAHCRGILDADRRDDDVDMLVCVLQIARLVACSTVSEILCETDQRIRLDEITAQAETMVADLDDETVATWVAYAHETIGKLSGARA